ncbi:MAG: 50S ribosomal protein L21 [Candidatus Zambryskibacteria bacterium]|nr:50S ribosomal protein L21 [Candidatus Zambryskibacteria bacterium]
MAEVKNTKENKTKKTAKNDENNASLTQVSKKSASKKVTPKAKKEFENSSFAVIETGGKQYRVKVGDNIKIEKLSTQSGSTLGWKAGDKIIFDKVLLVDNDKDITDIGTPYVQGAKVSGVLVEIGRNKKVTVLKYKAKSRYLKKNGHRQPYFKVKIEKIG